MTATLSRYGIVVSATEQTTLDDDRGITFWVQAGRDPHAEATRVFLSVDHADQVDEVELTIGAELTIDGVLRPDGILAATTLRRAPHRPAPQGRVLGTAPVHVPDLSRLDPWRERRYGLTLWGGLGLVIVLGVIGMVWSSTVGNASFLLFLALCAWLVWDDLRTRRIDDREYAALADEVVASVRNQLNIDVPAQAAFAMLGGGLERTGNPWRPTRPRRPGPAHWVAEAVGARVAIDIAPQPLQPDAPATVTVTALDPDHPMAR